MSEFETRYRKLNPQQKKAVDHLDGPVMVVAGPGTGKTELLSVRAANILDKTDASPHNILCLTYTESGASAMRERLAQLIGPDAYKVAVHTFHSFGSEIINRYGQYFYHGAHFRPADELSTYEVLCDIFDRLPASSLLSGKMNDRYTHLNDTQTAIGELKKSGLTPEELTAILDHNEAFIGWLQPHLDTALSPRLSKKQLPAIAELSEKIAGYEEDGLSLINYQPLAKLTHDSLERALEQTELEDSTRPVSEWKRRWLTKQDDGQLTLKDAKKGAKLREVADIYYQYLRAMQDRSLFDFDDMILRVVHGMELFNDLRYELQEQYHYIMIDEFQDTNDGQMRLIWNLTNASANEGRPNLLIVGDDDQAIYRFQGATLSNILDFDKLYRDVEIIPLIDNYRSDKEVLALARSVIIQAEERLETSLDDLDKSLTAHAKYDRPLIDYHQYQTPQHEYAALAEQLTAAHKADPRISRAVIARRHHQLRELLPYLQAKQLPLNYDREENVLEQEPIIQLELLSRVVDFIARGRSREAEALLPELLAHPAWQIEASSLWELSLKAGANRVGWLDTMLASGDRLTSIADWLLLSAQKAQHTGLEPMLDWLFGTGEQQGADNPQHEVTEPFSDSGQQEEFISPYRAYFFPGSSLDKQPEQYLSHLNALRTLRQNLREYRPDGVLRLRDFVNFVDIHHQLGLIINSSQQIGLAEGTIQLISAHSAKGLEFDEVYIIGLTDSIWGETARSRSKLVGFPHNLPLGFESDTNDERLRLLYVALTRAKERLHLSTHQATDGGKPTLPVGYLTTGLVKPESIATEDSKLELAIAETDWQSTYHSLAPATMKELLAPSLERYRLSSTHLTNFLDVSRGGPEQFLLHNLLRFPQAMSPSSAYGSAVHSALQRAHAQLRATGKQRPIEDILTHFEEELVKCQLDEADFERYQQRGSSVLSVFLEARYHDFTESQQAEADFSTEDIRLGEARLTGKIDLIDIDSQAKTITVTDYKTGTAVASWRGRTDYEKIKLYHYRQQLLFYKLLIEGSRQFSGYQVIKGVIEFVEPDRSGQIHRLEMDYNEAELDEFRSLIQAVWQRIQELDFKLGEEYPLNLTGIKYFEAILLK